jgi:hypothetical protein
MESGPHQREEKIKKMTEAYSLEQAANKLSISIWDFARLAIKEDLVLSDNNVVRYHLPHEVAEIKPETRKEEIKREETKKQTPEEFIVSEIRRLRTPNVIGYENYKVARNFSKIFKNIDYKEKIAEMESNGVVRIYQDNGEKFICPLEDKVSLEEIAAINTSQYEYPNKESWRKRWFNFTDEHLVNANGRKVLLLGGLGGEIDDYIKRVNSLEDIVVVEAHPVRAAYLKKKYQGIDVRCSWLNDYLLKTDEKFTEILLDFDGRLDQDKSELIDIIVKRGLLTKKSVLGTNFFANRECEKTKNLYLDSFLEKGFISDLGKSGFKDKVPSTVLDFNANLNGLRDYGITAIILKKLMGEEFSETNKNLLNTLPRDKKNLLVRNFSNYNGEEVKKHLIFNDCLRENLEKELNAANINNSLALICSAYNSKPYFVRRTERLAYRNNYGNNDFYSDFFALDQRQDHLTEVLNDGNLKRFISGKKPFSQLKAYFDNLKPKKKKSVNRTIGKCGDLLKSEYSSFLIDEETIPLRKRIGKGPKIKVPEKLRNNIVYILHQSKLNDENAKITTQRILKKYPSLTDSLAGIRSSYTKGHYNHLIKTNLGGK